MGERRRSTSEPPVQAGPPEGPPARRRRARSAPVGDSSPPETVAPEVDPATDEHRGSRAPRRPRRLAGGKGARPQPAGSDATDPDAARDERAGLPTHPAGRERRVRRATARPRPSAPSKRPRRAGRATATAGRASAAPPSDRLVNRVAGIGIVLVLGVAAVAFAIQPTDPVVPPGSTAGAAAAVSASASAATATTPRGGDPDLTGQVRRPRAGLYRYASSSRDPKAAPSHYAVQISAGAPTASGAPTDRLLSTSGTQTVDAYTAAGEVELSYSQVGTHITDELSCQDKPPRLVVALPLRPGGSWQGSTACTNLVGDSIGITSTTQVVGRNSVKVGSVPVPVWELVTVATETDTPARAGRPTASQTTATVDISARYGVVVRQIIQQGADPSSVRTDQLVSLNPA